MIKKTSIGALLKKHVASRLEPLGFEYQGSVAPNTWQFKKCAKYDQLIHFEKSNFVQGIRFDLSTSKSIEPRVYDRALRAFDDISMWSEYQNEQELETALTELTDLLIDKGLKVLSLLGEDEIRPTGQMHLDLYDNSLSYAQKFINQHPHIEGLDPIDSLEEIQALLKSLNSYPECTGVLMSISAYLGEMLKNRFNWRWEWFPKFSFTVVIGDNLAYAVQPLKWVMEYWNKPDLVIYNMVNRYRALEYSIRSREESLKNTTYLK